MGVWGGGQSFLGKAELLGRAALPTLPAPGFAEGQQPSQIPATAKLISEIKLKTL